MCGKGVETKSHKAFEDNFYVCRSYMGETGRWAPPPPNPLNRVKVKRAHEARVNQFLFQNVQNN